MAIANSYPKATPKADDLILGTVTPTPGSTQSPVTRNFEIDALADLIVSETNAVTGSGTTNTIPIWTDGPNGVLGDSIMVDIGGTLQVGTNTGQLTLLGNNFIASASIGTTQLTADNITSAETGVVLVRGNMSIGDGLSTPDTLTILSRVEDANSDLATDGQLLVGNAQSQLEWKDPEEVVSGAIAKLIPFQVTASAGGSSTYSADNNIVEIGWTGGNGTYVLNIPSAATIPYRNIRFVTNSTFPNGASDKVEITAQAGETIDGAAFFEISKQYEGVSLWSNGTEWIVIQAKAH